MCVQTTTETRGQACWGVNGTSANASRIVSRAGLGVRSAAVRPKRQSATSFPWRYHSSVQEKTKTPAQPSANAVRICQSSVWACARSPLRRLSSPSSLMISGRSPARFCNRATYASSRSCDSR